MGGDPTTVWWDGQRRKDTTVVSFRLWPSETISIFHSAHFRGRGGAGGRLLRHRLLHLLHFGTVAFLRTCCTPAPVALRHLLHSGTGCSVSFFPLSSVPAHDSIPVKEKARAHVDSIPAKEKPRAPLPVSVFSTHSKRIILPEMFICIVVLGDHVGPVTTLLPSIPPIPPPRPEDLSGPVARREQRAAHGSPEPGKHLLSRLPFPTAPDHPRHAALLSV